MFIYEIQNNITGKKYIGKTEKSIQSRWLAHCKHANAGVNRCLYDAMRKYGICNFSIRQVSVHTTREELDSAEIALIAELHTLDRQFGYNMHEGGTGGRHCREVMLRIGRKAADTRMRRKYRHSDNTRELISIAHIGMTASESTRKKISNTRILRFASGDIVSSWKTMKVRPWVRIAALKKRNHDCENVTYLMFIRLTIEEIAKTLELPITRILSIIKKEYNLTHLKYNYNYATN